MGTRAALGQAHTRQPDTLEQRMFFKCACKLGHAWTEPQGHGGAAGARSCRVLGAKPWPVVAVGGLHPENLSLDEFRLKESWRSCIPLNILALRETLTSAVSSPFLWLLLLSPSPTDL